MTVETGAVSKSGIDVESWQLNALCAVSGSNIRFDGFEESKDVETALDQPGVTTAAWMCMTCVVFEQCEKDVKSIPKHLRNFGSVQAARFVGRDGKLLDLRDHIADL